jgi:polyhydroxyalkanoate synthesis regulator phasin
MAGRTIEEIAADAAKLSEEDSQKKVDEIVASSNLSEEQKLTFAQDLMAKITPISGWASNKIESFTENADVKEITDETFRQLGLTLRAGAEGTAGLLGIIYDPLAAIVNTAVNIAGGQGDIPTASYQMSQILKSLGVPEPEDAAERVSNMVAGGLASGGGSVAIAKNLANFLTKTSAKVAGIMAANPGAQVIGSGTGGGSGQLAAEAGYGPVTQTVASLAGGLVGGKGANIKTEPVTEKIITTAKEAESFNVPVLTSDVRQPSTFAGKWLQKTGESLPAPLGTGAVRASQQELRIESVKELARSFGVNLGDDVDVLEIVSKDLLRKRGSDLSKYVNAKKSVINSLKTKGIVDVSRTVSVIDQEIDRLMRLRSGEMAPLIARLKDWKSAILGEKTVKRGEKTVIVREGQNLENIEMLRKQIGQSFEDPSLASVKQFGQDSLNKIYAPLREDMRTFIQNFGNKNDIKKFDVSNARLSELAGDLDNTLFKSVLKKGEITPEEINRILFSKKPSDVKLLFKNLDLEGRANARTAIISDMFKKSLNADQSISPDVFKSQIKKMSTQLGVFFNEKDLAVVEGLGKVLSLTKQASQANLLPPTGAMLQIPIISGFLMNSMGGVGGGLVGVMGVGAITRILESPAVRDILIKLPKLKAGSPEEAVLMKRLDDIIIKESGSVDEEEQESEPITVSSNIQSIIKEMSPTSKEKIINTDVG